MVKSQESANLDALRSLAVLAVLADHYVDSAMPWAVNKFPGHGLGSCGVLLFFIHTSLVLMMSLSRLERDGNGAVTVRFYIRRCFRLYPLSMLVILLAIAFRVPAYFHLPYVPVTWSRLWPNLLLVQNITGDQPVQSQYWSLPFEVQMYVLLPLIYFACKRIRSQALIIVAGFVVWYLELRLSRLLGYPQLLQYAPYFFMGVSVFFADRRSRWRLPTWSYFVCLALVLAVYGWTFAVDLGRVATWINWGAFALLAFLLPRFQELSAPLLCTACKLIARYSYGIYVTHVAIMWLCFERLGGAPVVWRHVLFAVLMVLLPVAFYHAVEHPFIRMGAALSNRLVGSPARENKTEEDAAAVNSPPP